MFNNLHEFTATIQSEQACIDLLAKHRWEDGKAVCPYCGHDKCYRIEGGKRYKCASKTCFKRFHVTVGTIFHASNIPLRKWFMAIYVATGHKKGISSYQLARDLGITQKSAWFMLHRIREGMRAKWQPKLGANNIVEADETYVGGSISNKSNTKRKEYAKNKDNWAGKTPVLGMLEREVSTVITRPHKIIPGLTVKEKIVTKESHVTLQVIPTGTNQVESIVRNNLEYAAKLVTDTHNYYTSLNDDYYHYKVNHTLDEYARWIFHTNSIEGTFSHFKRMVFGIYHQISPKHTQRYLDEFSYRFNTRKIKDCDRFLNALSKVNCKLPYKQLVYGKSSQESNKPKA